MMAIREGLYLTWKEKKGKSYAKRKMKGRYLGIVEEEGNTQKEIRTLRKSNTERKL